MEMSSLRSLTSTSDGSSPSPTPSYRNSRVDMTCPVCAIVREAYSHQNIRLCDPPHSGGAAYFERERIVYTSLNNMLELRLVNVSGSNRMPDINFLIKYEGEDLVVMAIWEALEW